MNRISKLIDIRLKKSEIHIFRTPMKHFNLDRIPYCSVTLESVRAQSFVLSLTNSLRTIRIFCTIYINAEREFAGHGASSQRRMI